MWQTTDYDYRGGYGDNCGFDGSFFTAPGPGIYSFHVTTRQDSVTTGNVYLYHIKSSANHVIVGHGSRSDDQNRNGNIIVQANDFRPNDIIASAMQLRLILKEDSSLKLTEISLKKETFFYFIKYSNNTSKVSKW